MTIPFFPFNYDKRQHSRPVKVGGLNFVLTLVCCSAEAPGDVTDHARVCRLLTHSVSFFSFHSMPASPIPFHAMLSHPIPSHPIPSRLIPSQSTPSYSIPSHPIPPHPLPSRPIPSHPIPSHFFSYSLPYPPLARRQVLTSNPLVESWGHFPRSRKRLLDLLQRTDPAGLVILSGDVHHAELASGWQASPPPPAGAVLRQGKLLYSV